MKLLEHSCCADVNARVVLEVVPEHFYFAVTPLTLDQFILLEMFLKARLTVRWLILYTCGNETETPEIKD